MIEIDGPFYQVTADGFVLTIPRWEGPAPDDTHEADATITLSDGSRYYATFMTLQAIQQVMDGHCETGECRSGGYFWASDLIITRRPGIPAMFRAVADLIATGGLAAACRSLGPDQDLQNGQQPPAGASKFQVPGRSPSQTAHTK